MRGDLLDSLSEPEHRLWNAFPCGVLVDLRDGPDDGPSRVDGWGDGRRVRAEVIVAVLTGAVPPRVGAVAGLRLAGARVTGNLDLSHARVECPVEFVGCVFDTGVSLVEASTCSVRFRGCVLPYLAADRFDLRGVFQASGCRLDWLSLYSARVTEVEISGTRFSRPADVAVNADLITVDSAMYCHDVRVEGQFRLAGAHIGGYLQLDGAQIVNEHGAAINAWGMVVGNGMYCRIGYTEPRDVFRATGGIDLSGAHVKGALQLDAAVLSNPDGAALDADQITVDGGLFCSGITTRGEIRVRSARISGPFTLAAATLSNPGGVALNAERIVADSGMFCHDRFTCSGDLRLAGADIRGQLDLGATPLADEPDRPAHPPTASAISGVVDLRYARIRTLRDDITVCPAQIRLDGLQYDGLTPDLPANQRLDWLARDPGGYQPQPYEQLAAHYRRIGDDEDARRVLLTKQRRRRTTLRPPGRAWGLIQDAIVGYGYRPWLAGLWLLGLLAAGTTYFAARPPAAHHPAEAPPFSPFAYTLDLLLPIINLGQENAWSVHGPGQAMAYVLIVAGWVLVTAVIAGTTRVLSRT